MRSAEQRGRIPPPTSGIVGIVVLASVVLTAFHFADNYISIETYPQPDWVTEAVVVVSWTLLTVIGVAGYMLYRRERFVAAQVCLLVYSYTGVSSLGHFLSGSPDEFTTRGLVSVLVDGVAGSTVLAVTVWSIVALRRRSAAGRAAVATERGA